jgi:hypothetical protein
MTMHDKIEGPCGRSCLGLLALLVAWAVWACNVPELSARTRIQAEDEPGILGEAAAKPSSDDAPSKGESQASLTHALLPCPAQVPAALDPPAEVTLTAALAASGTQVYVCAAGQNAEAPAWTLDGVHAVLTAGSDVRAIHFAGPSWQALDGSLVKGAKLAAADAPNAKNVPWLLLSGAPSGTGVFGDVTHIQRLDTAGGVAPTSGCEASHVGSKSLVPYKASYYFYRAATPGEKPHQCHSAPGKTKTS